MFGRHRDPATKTNQLRAMMPGQVKVIPKCDAAKWRGAVQNARRSVRLTHCNCNEWFVVTQPDGRIIIKAV